MEAMIFAAGLGTRLQDETTDKPKALVEVGGKTLLQRVIEKLCDAGVSKIVVNVHHFSELVIRFIESKQWQVPILISDESGKLLETGGGLKKAAHLFSKNEPVLIYNVDILSSINLNDLLQTHIETQALATLVVRERETQRYFKFDDSMQMAGWINKKTGEKKIARPDAFETAKELAFSGIHIVQPELFDLLPAEDRFSIVKVYLELARTEKILGFVDRSSLWMDVGKPAELEEARKKFSV